MFLLFYIIYLVKEARWNCALGNPDIAIVNATIYFIVDLIDSLITIVEEK